MFVYDARFLFEKNVLIREESARITLLYIGRISKEYKKNVSYVKSHFYIMFFISSLPQYAFLSNIRDHKAVVVDRLKVPTDTWPFRIELPKERAKFDCRILHRFVSFPPTINQPQATCIYRTFLPLRTQIPQISC